MVRIRSQIGGHVRGLRSRRRLAQLSSLGEGTVVHPTARLRFPSRIQIGNSVRIGAHCHLDGEGGLVIGDGSILAPHVVILTSSHNYLSGHLIPYDEQDKLQCVVVGAGSWFGWGASVAPGAVLGRGCIVAMRAHVVGAFEDLSIVGGNPARVIGSRPTEHLRLVEEGRFFLSAVRDGLVRPHRPGANIRRWMT